MEIRTSFLQNSFLKLINNNRLSHAYLLWGYGVGGDMAQQVISVIELFEPQPFVDCLVVRPTDGTIGIDTVREARRFISQRPVRADRKILVVMNAETLTTEAQNAILKTVEEPPTHGLIIFTMREPSLLVPALQSRFQKLYVSTKLTVKSYKLPVIERFLKGTATERKEIIKQLVEEDEGAFSDFIAGLMAELDKNPLKNYHGLKELLRRWTVMNQLTTNRRLQLEAVAACL